jgi:hypothetical protein
VGRPAPPGHKKRAAQVKNYLGGFYSFAYGPRGGRCGGIVARCSANCVSSG